MKGLSPLNAGKKMQQKQQEKLSKSLQTVGVQGGDWTSGNLSLMGGYANKAKEVKNLNLNEIENYYDGSELLASDRDLLHIKKKGEPFEQAENSKGNNPNILRKQMNFTAYSQSWAKFYKDNHGGPHPTSGGTLPQQSLKNIFGVSSPKNLTLSTGNSSDQSNRSLRIYQSKSKK